MKLLLEWYKKLEESGFKKSPTPWGSGDKGKKHKGWGTYFEYGMADDGVGEEPGIEEGLEEEEKTLEEAKMLGFVGLEPIREKSESEAQRKMMGVALSMKRGEEEPKGQAGEISKEMSEDDLEDFAGGIEEEEEKKSPLNKPIRTSGGSKKFKVYVKDPSTGNVKTVRFGDPNMEIKRDDPDRRKSFHARHNCDNPGPKTKARYWSCYQWRNGKKVVSEKKIKQEE